MSFNADKKREHESLAEKALADRDYSRAFFHTAKAADFGLRLAELSVGRLARAYLSDAKELLDIAAQLKGKALSTGESRHPAEPLAHDGNEPGPETDGASPWQLAERPDVKLAEVAGLEPVKTALLEDVILPLRHPEVYDRFGDRGGGGVLLYGPPGNGKTFIAKAVAGELDATFFTADASQIKDKYVGETEKNMRRLFEAARQHQRAVIFFDEIDALLHNRGAHKVNAVTQFLILSDGIQNASKENLLLLLGATNAPWTIDPAVLRPGRFGRQIYVGLPDQDARAQIIKHAFSSVPTADLPLPELASRMDGYSGADVSEVCRRAKKRAILRQIESGNDELVTGDDVNAVMRDFVPSVRQDDLVRFGEWKNANSPPSAATI